MSKGMSQKMAIAQALLLPSPGLLVLDEAWTGLDQAARGALDDAVADRVAAGGTVLFVDHDPARLAGREDERWSFDGAGRVTVLAGPAQRAPRLDRVTVRLETSDTASLVEQVRAMDGVRVLSVDVEGGSAGTDSPGADSAGTDSAGTEDR
jgi:ABC-type multidrug transport system ATPase subunit